MQVTIEGECRKVKECMRKDGTLVKTRDGKQIYILRIEQRTDGPTIGIDIGTEKNSFKVGDKVSMKVNAYAQLTKNNKAVLKMWAI